MHALVSMGLVVTNELYRCTGLRSDDSVASVAATRAITGAATIAAVLGEMEGRSRGEESGLEEAWVRVSTNERGALGTLVRSVETSGEALARRNSTERAHEETTVMQWSVVGGCKGTDGNRAATVVVVSQFLELKFGPILTLSRFSDPVLPS